MRRLLVPSESSATRAAKRLASTIIAALVEPQDYSRRGSDSVSKLSYVLGLQKALSILLEEVKKEKGQK